MPQKKRKGVPGRCSLPSGYQHPPWLLHGAAGGYHGGIPAWMQSQAWQDDAADDNDDEEEDQDDDEESESTLCFI